MTRIAGLLQGLLHFASKRRLSPPSHPSRRREGTSGPPAGVHSPEQRARARRAVSLPPPAGLLALLLLPVLVGCTREPQQVRIGLAQPLTGPFALLGTDMRRGAELAIAELNGRDPRIDGGRLRFEAVVVDDQSDPAIAERTAGDLAAKRVSAVIGHLNSGASIAAAPVYAKAGIPQLSISTQTRYTALGVPTTFRLVASDLQQSRALAVYAGSLAGDTPLGIIDDGTSYGRALSDLAARILSEQGRRVQLQRSVASHTVDFSESVKAIADSATRVLVCALSDEQVIALSEQLAAAGVKGVQIVGSDTLKTSRLLGRRLPYPVYASSPVLEPLEFHGGRPFVEAFQKAYGEPPLYGAHYAYDAVFLLYAAMRHANSTRPPDLTRALRELDFVAPVNSTLKFGPDGEPLYGSVGIYRPIKGRWEVLANSDRW